MSLGGGPGTGRSWQLSLGGVRSMAPATCSACLPMRVVRMLQRGMWGNRLKEGSQGSGKDPPLPVWAV